MEIGAPQSPHNEALCSNEWDPGIPKYVLAKNLDPPALLESHSFPLLCLHHVV